MSQFIYKHRVRYYEADQQRHVYNARYLEYVDNAMTEFFRELGWGYRDLIASGCDPALVHVEMSFHRPAPFDAELEIGVFVDQVGRSSFTLKYDIRLDAARILSASVAYVNYDTATKSACPLPEAVRNALLSQLDPVRCSDRMRQ